MTGILKTSKTRVHHNHDHLSTGNAAVDRAASTRCEGYRFSQRTFAAKALVTREIQKGEEICKPLTMTTAKGWIN